MDGRVRFAVSGIATVAASIAVVCAVSLTNAAALADSAGRPLALTRIDVPIATPAVSPSAAPIAPAKVESSAAPVASLPETVPAPAAQDVVPTASTAPTGDVAAVTAPASVPTSAPIAETSEHEFLAGAAAASTWDRALQWARSRGWSDAEIARWVARNPTLIAELKTRWQAAQTPASGAGSPSVSDESSRDGSKKDQSPSSPDRRG